MAGSQEMLERKQTFNPERYFEFVSDLFHPISNAGIAFFLLTMFTGSNDIVMKTIYFIIALSFSMIIPFLYIFSLKRKGHLETVDITERMQRLNPFAFSILSYFAGFIVLRLADAPLHVQGLMFCYGSNTLLVMLVTRWWKVSVHTTGIAGPLVALTFGFGTVVYPFYSLIILVGLSRIVLKRHTIMQVLAGGLIGLSLTALQFAIFFS